MNQMRLCRGSATLPQALSNPAWFCGGHRGDFLRRQLALVACTTDDPTVCATIHLLWAFLRVPQSLADGIRALGSDELGSRMKQIIEYFDRAYVINLSDRPDRRHQAEQEFRRAGINIPNGNVQFYTAVRPTDKGRFENIGTRGCFNSHRGILEIADQERLRNVLIFEDDVSFRDIGVAFERQLMTRLSHEDWDVV